MLRRICKLVPRNLLEQESVTEAKKTVIEIWRKAAEGR